MVFGRRELNELRRKNKELEDKLKSLEKENRQLRSKLEESSEFCRRLERELTNAKKRLELFRKVKFTERNLVDLLEELSEKLYDEKPRSVKNVSGDTLAFSSSSVDGIISASILSYFFKTFDKDKNLDIYFIYPCFDWYELLPPEDRIVAEEIYFLDLPLFDNVLNLNYVCSLQEKFNVYYFDDHESSVFGRGRIRNLFLGEEKTQEILAKYLRKKFYGASNSKVEKILEEGKRSRDLIERSLFDRKDIKTPRIICESLVRGEKLKDNEYIRKKALIGTLLEEFTLSKLREKRKDYGSFQLVELMPEDRLIKKQPALFQLCRETGTPSILLYYSTKLSVARITAVSTNDDHNLKELVGYILKGMKGVKERCSKNVSEATISLASLDKKLLINILKEYFSERTIR